MRSWANRFVVTSAMAACFVPGAAFAAEEARPHPRVQQPSRVEAEPPPARREQPRVDPGSGTREVVSRGGGSASGRLVPADGEAAGRPDGPVRSKPFSRIVQPPSPARYTERPTSETWRLRALDVETYIKRLARQVGLVRSLLVPDELTVVKGRADRPAGLSSYAFVVPGKGTIRVSLSHPNEGWLRIGMVDKEGHPEKGMAQNLVDDRRLQVSFKNPRDEARIVHVLVGAIKLWN